jgi:hypothetical protein
MWLMDEGGAAGQRPAADGAVNWRPLTPADAGDLAALFAAIRVADGSWEYFTEQDLLEDFGNPQWDFPRGSTALHDGDLLVGYGDHPHQNPPALAPRDCRWRLGWWHA